MKKVLVIGSGGAGKSTFAHRLHKATGLPLIHLDKIHWQPNWTAPPKPEWRKTVEKLLAGDEWVMDGNFGSTMDIRFRACDTIFYFDLPPLVCVYQALKRVAKYYKKTRPDMGAGCAEKLDFEFLEWVWNFPKNSKPEIEEKLALYAAGKNIIRFKSRKDVERFFENLARNKVESVQ